MERAGDRLKKVSMCLPEVYELQSAMDRLRFHAIETVELEVVEEHVSIRHYLRQPQRLVRTIADPDLMQQLGPTRYRLEVRPLNVLDIYQFRPMAVLSVTADSDGTVLLRAEHAEVIGNDYINDRFSLRLQGKLAPVETDEGMSLRGRAELSVEVELPPPLQMMPRQLVESTGNSLLKGVLQRIKKRILGQLVADYRNWVRDTETGDRAAADAQQTQAT